MKNRVSNIDDCKIITLPKIHNPSGNITVLENNANIPFEVNRVYYLYDVPSNQERGGHAHYNLSQYIIAATGSFDIVLKDKNNTKLFTLNKPNQALYLVPGLWREINNFSGGSICLVLASHEYEESDYIRNFDEFLKWKL